MIAQDIIVNNEVLENYWDSIVGKSNSITLDHSKLLFIEGFKNIVSEDDPNGLLYLKADAFEVRLLKSAYHHAATHAITSTLIQHFEVSELPVSILHILVSCVFDTKRITISPEHEAIYLSLFLKDEQSIYLSADEWYAILPDDARIRINKSDFREFLDKMVYTGFALTNQKKYLILEEQDKKLQIHIKL